jgi:hypothetical protein
MQAGFIVNPNVNSPSWSAGGTLTVTGTQVVNGQTQAVLDLNIPEIGVNATNLSASNSAVTLSDGRRLVFGLGALNYSLYGVWAVTPDAVGDASSSVATAVFLSGYQTPNSGVPTGTATYNGNNATTGTTGGVVGIAFAPSATNTLASGAIQGQANMAVNFSTGAVSGSLTNMTVSVAGGATAPWNNVSLSGSLSGSALSGTTGSSGTPPSGLMSFDASSTGTFNGALFGPNGQELGAVWTLYDPTGLHKSAVGVIGATKQ